MRIKWIIRGKGEGKTTAFLRLYRCRNRKPDGSDIGFWEEKVYDGDTLAGYRIRSLDGSRSWLLASRHRIGDYHQGQWYFDLRVFDDCLVYVESQPLPSCLWIDEIGRLEVDGRGFFPLIAFAIRHDIDMVLTVRTRYAASMKRKLDAYTHL